MLPVRLTLACAEADQPGGGGFHVLEAALWAHAQPEYGLEHLRVGTVPCGVGVALFLRAADPAAARRQAERLVGDALAAAGPELHRYTLLSN